MLAIDCLPHEVDWHIEVVQLLPCKMVPINERFEGLSKEVLRPPRISVGDGTVKTIQEVELAGDLVSDTALNGFFVISF